MANIYSSYTPSTTGAGPVVDAAKLGGKARLYPFLFTFSTAGATPVLYMTRVPAGTTVWAIFIANTAMSASAGVGLNIDIGDADDTNRLYNDYDGDAANTGTLYPTLITDGFGYRYAADTWLIGTVTAGTPDDASVFRGFFVTTAE